MIFDDELFDIIQKTFLVMKYTFFIRKNNDSQASTLSLFMFAR